MQMSSSPYKVCPQCQTPAHLQAGECERCGRLYHTQFVPSDQTQAFVPPPQFQPAPPFQPMFQTVAPPADKSNPLVIGILWTCTVLSYFLLKTDRTLGLMVDVIAICCAIALVMSPNRTNKTNGKVKLTLELIGVIIGFCAVVFGGLHPTAPPTYETESSEIPMR